MHELALFAGSGGGILGGTLLGWTTICGVEINPYSASVLLARQTDGVLAPFPVWDDIRTFDGRPWRGLVDVVSGGFPCQDISAAGKGAGLAGSRSGLWWEMFRIICEVQPPFVFLENSPLLTSRGLDVILGALASVGYDAEWGVFGADNVGAPHVRKRIWILAYDPDSHRVQRPKLRRQHKGTQVPQGGSRDKLVTRATVADPNSSGLQKHQRRKSASAEISSSQCHGAPLPDPALDGHVWGQWSGRADRPAFLHGDDHGRGADIYAFREWWRAEPSVGRLAHGVAARVEQLAALGNGQVPAVAETAFLTLLGSFLSNPR